MAQLTRFQLVRSLLSSSSALVDIVLRMKMTTTRQDGAQPPQADTHSSLRIAAGARVLSNPNDKHAPIVSNWQAPQISVSSKAFVGIPGSVAVAYRQGRN